MGSAKTKTKQQLLRENEELRLRLAEAEGTLRAIRGDGDRAVVAADPTESEQPTELLQQLGQQQEPPERVNEPRQEFAGAVHVERQRLKVVLDLLPAYVILLSPDYRVPFANRFFEERFGKSEGRRCYEYLFHRTGPCENCESYKVFKTNTPLRWEWTGPDGRNYDIHDFPFTDADGSPLIMEVGLDITERKRAEAAIREANETLEQHVADRTTALEQATEELRRSNQDLEQFAYAASHDLQEPLRAVSGFLKLLAEQYKPQLDEKAREFIGYAVDGSRRMSEMIRDLLAYSRVRRKGKAPKWVDAEKSLAAALANLEAGVREAGARITHDPLPALMIDDVQLTQLFQNLVGNAVKFRRPEQPCLVHVGAQRRGDRWLLSVRDNGIGIPPEQHDRVFEVFQRLHSREKYAGTGIGLAICKKILQQHGGEIGVESAPGHGSTFHFSLPAGDG
jgi:signal transduction histidine kinase